MSGSNISNLEGREPADPPRAKGGSRSHVGRWVLLLIVIIGVVVAYQMHSRSQAASKDSSTTQPVSVGVTTVQKRDMPYYLTGPGFRDGFQHCDRALACGRAAHEGELHGGAIRPRGRCARGD